MKRFLYFISSDARPLYLKDVYRVLSLPHSYIIQFRYRQEYIDQELCKEKKIINQKGVIFFQYENNLEVSSDERNQGHISLREVTVKDFEISPNTGLFHYYLKLGKFIDCSFDDCIIGENTYVGTLNLTDSPREVMWKDKINSVNQCFKTKNKIFFYIDKIYCSEKYSPKVCYLPILRNFIGKDKLEIAEYEPKAKKSFFHLYSKTQYCIKVCYCALDDAEGNVEIKATGNNLILERNKLISEALLDDTILLFCTKADSDLTYDHILFISEEGGIEFDVKLNFKISKNHWGYFLIGAFILVIIWLGEAFSEILFYPSKLETTWTKLSVFAGIVVVMTLIFIFIGYGPHKDK